MEAIAVDECRISVLARSSSGENVGWDSPHGEEEVSACFATAAGEIVKEGTSRKVWFERVDFHTEDEALWEEV